MAEVYLNGKYVGDVEHAKEFVQRIRDERRRAAVTHTLNAYYDEALNQAVLESGT